MAQVDYFLKITNVKGESTDEKHKGEIELESFSLGGTNAASFSSGGGGGAGKVALQDFHFTKKVDAASVKLFVAMATGEHLASAVLTCRKAGKEQQEYIIIKMNDIIVTSVQPSGSSENPVESFSLQPGKIDIEYKPQKPDGTLDAGLHFKYDMTANKEG